MAKINAGSNVNKDNETGTATERKFQCPVCDRIFNSRENYEKPRLSSASYVNGNKSLTFAFV